MKPSLLFMGGLLLILALLLLVLTPEAEISQKPCPEGSPPLVSCFERTNFSILPYISIFLVTFGTVLMAMAYPAEPSS